MRSTRQREAVASWSRLREQRERAWRAAAASREDKLDAQRRLAVLARADEVLRRRLAAGEPTGLRGPVAVVAHPHAWFTARLTQRLEERAVEVVQAGPNGADALGVVIAEQPDLVVVGEALEMMPGLQVLAEAALLAPASLLAVQVAHGDHVGRALDVGARTAFTRAVPPAQAADDLCALLAGRPA